MRNLLTFTATLALLAGAAVAGSPLRAAGEGGKETFTGQAIPVGTVGARGALGFTAYVDSWCTEEERKALYAALIDSGQRGLVKQLKTMKHGRIVIGPRTGYDINAAISLATERGRLVRLVLERPINIRELYVGTRSTDYKFAFLEFELEGDKDGTGQMIVAAQISVQKNGTVEVESYGVQPVKLMGVQSR
jgi:hypothetical protein